MEHVIKGNGTVGGINGELSITEKEGALMIISDLVEQFELSPVDLGFR